MIDWDYTIAAAATYYAAIAAFWCATWVLRDPVDDAIDEIRKGAADHESKRGNTDDRQK